MWPRCWLWADTREQSLGVLQFNPDFIIKTIRIKMHDVVPDLSNTIKDTNKLCSVDC